MPLYSKKSTDKLLTCHEDLVTVMEYVVDYFDNTIVYGHRTPREQYVLYQKGRKYDVINRKWDIVDPAKVVTYKDGYLKKSMHNQYPSMAVDAVAYPIDWNDKKRQLYFAGFVMGIANKLFNDGVIKNRIRCGCDWDGDTQVKDERFEDLYHFEIAI
jgi:peptidoglycan L-alanyl-D-glutamate endopeptidase CwlK